MFAVVAQLHIGFSKLLSTNQQPTIFPLNKKLYAPIALAQ